MTDAEATFVAALTQAAWPLPLQLLSAAAFVIGYWVWSRHAYAAVDRAVRAWLGQRLGVAVVWVPRNTAEYATPFYYRGRYRRWSWGIAAEADRTFTADGVVATASVVVVNIVAGAVPLAAPLYAAVSSGVWSYVVLLPASVAVIAIYSVYWSGHYRVAWMRGEG